MTTTWSRSVVNAFSSGENCDMMVGRVAQVFDSTMSWSNRLKLWDDSMWRVREGTFDLLQERGTLLQVTLAERQWFPDAIHRPHTNAPA